MALNGLLKASVLAPLLWFGLDLALEISGGFSGKSLGAMPLPVQEVDQTAERIRRASKNISDRQTYRLAYQLEKDEVLQWDVEHVASTKTRMAGETEETASRSVSRKVWQVSSVDSLGNMTFVHRIDAIDMWQKIGDDPPIAYNSRTDKEPPAEYEATAEKLKKPLAVITITPDGQVKDRKTSLPGVRFGVGDITIPLPDQPIAVGQKWSTPTTLSATDEHGRNLELKARLAYELVKVAEGKAYIQFRTEVLTPVESDKVKSQIMQQKTKGFVVFDIQRGLPVRKEVEWNETVQGFEGADSFIEYLGKMTEKLVESGVQQQARLSGSLNPLELGTEGTPDQDWNIQTREQPPVFRK